MSQHGSTQPSLRSNRGRTGLAALALACATSLCGCQLAENIDVAQCSIPPNHPHQFDAPVSYGHFPTLWRPWPGAETGPGQSPARPKSRRNRDDETTTEESLPEPTPETTPETGLEPGLENVFDAPTDTTPDEGEPGGQMPPDNAPEEPTDTTLPDELIPPKEDAPATEEEPLPDQLIPEDDTKAEPTPEQGAWSLESLPADAPEGALIPNSRDAIARKAARPGLLMPGEPTKQPRKAERIENAKRPSPTRGASAIERPEKASFLASFRDHKPSEMMSSDANSEGPQLTGQGVPQESPLPQAETMSAHAGTQRATAAPPSSDARWLSVGRDDHKDSTAASVSKQRSPTPVADKSTTAWRGNPAPKQATPRNVADSAPAGSGGGWQRSASRGSYPGRQTSHFESKPRAVERAAAAEQASGSTNPLR